MVRGRPRQPAECSRRTRKPPSAAPMARVARATGESSFAGANSLFGRLNGDQHDGLRGVWEPSVRRQSGQPQYESGG